MPRAARPSMCGVRAGVRACSGERSSRMKWRTLRFMLTTDDAQEEEEL